MKITFDAPPLSEVVMGITFVPRDDFLVPYFGSFWEMIRKQFPVTRHAAPLVEQNEVPFGAEGYYLPRVWFLSEDETTIIQLQQNRFLFNWREVKDKANPYVRYERLRNDFLELWARYSDFVEKQTGQALQPIRYELTYINFMAESEESDSFTLAKRTFRSFALPSSEGEAPQIFNCQLKSELAKDLGSLSVGAGTANTNDGRKGLRLELSVRSKNGEENPFVSWADNAHDVIVSSFKDMTTAEMHAVWKLREE